MTTTDSTSTGTSEERSRPSRRHDFSPTALAKVLNAGLKALGAGSSRSPSRECNNSGERSPYCIYCQRLGHAIELCQTLARKQREAQQTLRAPDPPTRERSASPSASATGIIVRAPELEQGKGEFTVDTGAGVNLVNINALGERAPVINETAEKILGITRDPLYTLGTTTITTLGKTSLFYVYDAEGIDGDGLLGAPFCLEHQAEISFYHKTIVSCEAPIKPIPFSNRQEIDQVGREYRKATLRLEARSRTQIPIPVKNGGIREGYLPRITGPPRVFIGEAAVSNHDDTCYTMATNTGEEAVEITIAPQELEPYDLTMESISTEDEADPDDSGKERVTRIIEGLRMDHLNAEERQHVVQVLNEFQDCFHLPGDRLGKTNTLAHQIPTTDDAPIHTRQYRFPPVHQEEIQKQVRGLLENGIIKPSSSPYNSPLWIVPKKPDSKGNKRWRMVIDYRALNERTVGDSYPLPNITDILDRVSGAKYFSVFDLASGFHQIGMDPKDEPKTAFSTPNGHYEYARMPFGLRNAPATFQRLMDIVLSGLQGSELFVYLDDIVVYSANLQQHGYQVRRLLTRLRKHGLKLQTDKCEFLRTEVTYLGHTLSVDGVQPNTRNLDAVRGFPVPKTERNIKQFLGLAGYYRRFIPDFAEKARPMTVLLKKTAAFGCGEAQRRSFEELRDLLCREPVLKYPDFEKPFILTTDASDYALGAVLGQSDEEGERTVSYASRLLTKPEINYSTSEKECLAVIFAINYFRPYLYGRKFTLYTDHQALVWLHNVKDPTSRLTRWRLRLAEYDFRIVYKKGTQNSNADALSRNPVAQCLPLHLKGKDKDTEYQPPITTARGIETSTIASRVRDARRTIPINYADDSDTSNFSANDTTAAREGDCTTAEPCELTTDQQQFQEMLQEKDPATSRVIQDLLGEQFPDPASAWDTIIEAETSSGEDPEDDYPWLQDPQFAVLRTAETTQQRLNREEADLVGETEALTMQAAKQRILGLSDTLQGTPRKGTRPGPSELAVTQPSRSPSTPKRGGANGGTRVSFLPTPRASLPPTGRSTPYSTSAAPVESTDSETDEEEAKQGNETRPHPLTIAVDSLTEYDDTSDEEATRYPAQDTIAPRPKRHRRPRSSVHVITDTLTLQKGNYAHFISADCALTTPVGRQLREMGLVRPENLLEVIQGRGHAIITPHRRGVTFSIACMNRYYHRMTPESLAEGLKTLKAAMEIAGMNEARIAAKGDGIDHLPISVLESMAREIFQGTSCKIHLCTGKTETPPPDKRPAIIKQWHKDHTGGHKGVAKTYHRLRRRYHWPGMRNEVQDCIRCCESCQKQKVTRIKTREPMMITDTPVEAWEKIGIDIVGPLPTTSSGNKYILTVLDLLTKLGHAWALPDQKSLTVIRVFDQNYFKPYSVPLIILSDRGRSFDNENMKEFLRINGVNHVMTSGYHPQTNGSLERSHTGLVEYLRHFTNDQAEWDTLLPDAMRCYNAAVHEGTKFTPHEMAFGKPKRTPGSLPLAKHLPTTVKYMEKLVTRLDELAEEGGNNLNAAKRRSKERYDRKINPVTFNVGDQVYAKREARTKLDPYYDGPYEVVELLGLNTAIITDRNGKRKLKHLDKLKRKDAGPKG
ncbi:uncharacterized protein LOC125500979 [Athalia rosae]|uniref:uncharacterized protein LOC125500979 n=1 Tax=Athalia rosae TaxID=37344 RepID=UPI002034A601|nr:uncharacterized protein LOC125500979 [Athalia rosae]